MSNASDVIKYIRRRIKIAEDIQFDLYERFMRAANKLVKYGVIPRRVGKEDAITIIAADIKIAIEHGWVPESVEEFAAVNEALYTIASHGMFGNKIVGYQEIIRMINTGKTWYGGE